MSDFQKSHYLRLDAVGYVGIVLVTLCWILNWSLSGLRTHLLFFPQWLGYCLVIDAIVRQRKGSSLLSRNPGTYVILFLVSAPVWWVFEGLNKITRNWIYLGRDQFCDFAYFLLSSLCFSTVIPAVFSTAELLLTFKWLQRLKRPKVFSLNRIRLLRLHFAGWAMLLLLIVVPDVFFPFLWLSLLFILDPLNALRGRPSLVDEASRGDFRRIAAYGLGALGCGFFWELWNIYSYPKWIYDIPYLEFWHIFEMPLAGYGGYIPFGWELFAVYFFFFKKL
jgi:hypothetical protein